MTVTTVIFDFDGTLANSLPVLLDVAREVFDIDREFDDGFIRELREMSQSEILTALNISKFQALLHWEEGKERFADRIHEITLFDGVEDALESLESSYELGILTNNDAGIVQSFLDHHGLDMFSFVEDNHIFESKARRLSSIIDELDVAPASVVYVGDQVSDIEAAHQAGCEAVAVAWGYNTANTLEDAYAEKLIAEPADLLRVVQSL